MRDKKVKTFIILFLLSFQFPSSSAHTKQKIGNTKYFPQMKSLLLSPSPYPFRNQTMPLFNIQLAKMSGTRSHSKFGHTDKT